MHAGEVLREQQLLPIDDRHQHHAGAQFQGGFHGVGNAALAPGLPRYQPVHHHLNGVLPVLIQLELLGQVMDFPINPNPGIAGLAQVIKDRLILTLAVPYQWRQNQDVTTSGDILNGINNLLHRLRGYLPPALRTVRMTDAGKKQPQVIIGLGYCAHSGARIFRRPLLVNRYGGAQALNIVNLRLLHPAQELAGISR